jgi:hypothetical protein
MALFPTTDTIPSRALRDIRTGLNTMTIVFTYVTLRVVHMRRAKPVGLLVDERVLSAIKGPFGTKQLQHHLDKHHEFFLGGG